MNIPQGTTHVWTPAFYKPVIGFISRRPFYKKVKGVWYTSSGGGDWRQSGNPLGWFEEEKKLGYFVTIKKFHSEGFIPVEENK